MDKPLACDSLRYSIFDPTGNITALVETPVAISAQPAAAASIMRRHPEVEQVGFVRLARSSAEETVDAELRMAGGEFCGNTSMSAGALLLLRRGGKTAGEQKLRLRVSGASRPVELRLREEGEKTFRAGVCMPRALAIEEQDFAFADLRGRLKLVRMQGISHIVIPESSPFFTLKEERERAEAAVRAWCGALSAECLGLMFLENGERLTPLVYVPGSGTVFWESSCASGTAAVGMALAVEEAGPVSLALLEPGGSLRVESDPVTGETWLYGQTRLTEER